MARHKFTSEEAKEAGQKKGKHVKTKMIENLLENLSGKHSGRFDKILNNMEDEEFAKTYKDLIKFITPVKTHNILDVQQPTKIIFENVSKIDNSLLEDQKPKEED